MTLLANARVVTPDHVLEPGWVEVTGDRLSGVGGGAPPSGSGPQARAAEVPAEELDLSGRIVVPGFIDTHVHGGHGGSYFSATPEATARVAQFHLGHGTTTTLASLISTTASELERQVAALADLVAAGRSDADHPCASIAGIHLEGPWLSEIRRGAHNPAMLRPPARDEVERLLELGRGAVAMVTLAPELSGGLDAVRQVVEAGAVAAVGHSDADYDTVLAAVDAGASVGTHLFNGMPPMHHRGPGSVGALLEHPRVSVELVADGIHLHPATIGLAVRAAGAERVSLVTDAMAAAGVGDGLYELGERSVQVTNGEARLVGQDSIAGSTLTMDAAFRFVVTQVGLSLEQAARVAATTPARAFGLSDVGALRTGMRADLVVLDDDLAVVGVMRRGTWVSGPPGRAT